MNKNDQRPYPLAPVDPDWSGLARLDGDRSNRFVAAVEAAFEALNQPAIDFGEDEDADDYMPRDPARFREWVETVEVRLENMGLTRARLESSNNPTSPLSDLAVATWARRIWSRLAALGQVLPDLGEKASADSTNVIP